MEVLQWLHNMLGGSSPQTGYIGSIGIITSLIGLISEYTQAALAESGTPSTKLGWGILIVSIGLRLAKDANKSNSPTPTPVAVTVPGTTVTAPSPTVVP